MTLLTNNSSRYCQHQRRHQRCRAALAGLLMATIIALIPMVGTASPQFRVMVNASAPPPPNTQLARVAAQTVALPDYLSQRLNVDVDAIDGQLPDGPRSAGSQRRSQSLPTAALDTIAPRGDELVVMGFDNNGAWVFVDYITDPWITRAEPWLHAGDADHATATRYYSTSPTRLLLTLPAEVDIATLDLMRPHYHQDTEPAGRQRLLTVDPLLRIRIPLTAN